MWQVGLEVAERHAPAQALPQQHDEQGGGIGGAVVDLPGGQVDRGGRAVADLVQDAPRLLFRLRMFAGALQGGQYLQHADRQAGVGDQAFVGAEQRVPPEHRHEPGRPRRDHRAPVPARIEQPQGADVGERLIERLLQRRPVRFQLGHTALPCFQPLARRGVVDRFPAEVLRFHLGVADRHRHLQAGGPHAMGRDLDLPQRVPGLHGARAVGADQYPAAGRVVPPVLHGVARDLVTGATGGLRGAPLLHREQVGEVDVIADLDPHAQTARVVVADFEILAQATPHVTAAHHHQRAQRPF